jgi:hypothetical protein
VRHEIQLIQRLRTAAERKEKLHEKRIAAIDGIFDRHIREPSESALEQSPFPHFTFVGVKPLTMQLRDQYESSNKAWSHTRSGHCIYIRKFVRHGLDIHALP